MHRGLNATNVIFFKLSLNVIVNFMQWNLTDSGKILQLSQHVVLISYKFHGDWPRCYKTIRGKVSVSVYAYGHVYACKRNGRFLDTKNQLDALIRFAYILVDVSGICSWSIPVNRMQQVLEMT